MFTFVSISYFVVSAILPLYLLTILRKSNKRSRSVAWDTEVIEKVETVEGQHRYSDECLCNNCRIIYWFETNLYARVLDHRMNTIKELQMASEEYTSIGVDILDPVF
jgi:hypothetical protein